MHSASVDENAIVSNS